MLKEELFLKERGYYRWVSLAIAIAIAPYILMAGSVLESLFMFGTGMILALIIDFTGIWLLKLWVYPRQRFLSREYFGIVLPAWGVFGVATNIIWPYCGTGFQALTISTVLLFLVYEIPNIRTLSWCYSVPLPIVFAGWFPLVAVYRLSYLAI